MYASVKLFFLLGENVPEKQKQRFSDVIGRGKSSPRNSRERF